MQQHEWQAPGTPITRLRCAQDTRLWRSLQFQDDQYNLTATQATRVISMASTRFSPAQLVRRCADACVWCGVARLTRTLSRRMAFAALTLPGVFGWTIPR